MRQTLKSRSSTPPVEGTKGRPMDFSATEILSFLSGGGHIVRDTSREALVVKAANGNDLEVDVGGFAYSPVELQAAQFDDLRAASLIAQDGRNADGNSVWRLTRDGKLKGLAEA